MNQPVDFPSVRSGECPFDPPAELLEFQDTIGVGLSKSWDGEPWIVTGYDACREALADPVLSSDPRKPGFSEKSPAFAATLGAERNLRTMDDPEHAFHRRLLMPEFTVRALSKLEAAVHALVDQRLDALESMDGPVDLVPNYALPIPLETICELLGVPRADGPLIAACAERMIGETTYEEAGVAAGELSEYVKTLIDLRRREPDDRLVSRLVQDDAYKAVMSDSELVDTVSFMVVAGHESTANHIGLCIITLLQNPDVLVELRDTEDPRVVANAMEELLRYHSPSHLGRRRVTTGTTEIAGKAIPTEVGVIVATTIADRDPKEFEDPHTLDIHRSNARKHLAFGYGVHQCLGQHLMRMEVRYAIPQLLKRFPDIRLAVPFEDIVFRESATVYGVESLPVVWGSLENMQ